jgi:hypothetical protein
MYAGVPKTAPSRAAGAVERRVELGEAEVQDLGEQLALFVLREEDVLGLQIAVDDVGRVRLGEATAGLRDDRERRLDVEVADLRHSLVERLAFEQLEHEERRSLLEASGVVDVADVRAADGRGGARFAEEALDDHPGRRQLLREHLDGDALADVDVLGLVHGGHPATPDFARDLVLPRQDGSYRDLRRGRGAHQVIGRPGNGRSAMKRREGRRGGARPQLYGYVPIAIRPPDARNSLETDPTSP